MSKDPTKGIFHESYIHGMFGIPYGTIMVHGGASWCMVGHHGGVRVQAMADWDSTPQLALQNWAMGL